MLHLLELASNYWFAESFRSNPEWQLKDFVRKELSHQVPAPNSGQTWPRSPAFDECEHKLAVQHACTLLKQLLLVTVPVYMLGHVSAFTPWLYQCWGAHELRLTTEQMRTFHGRHGKIETTNEEFVVSASCALVLQNNGASMVWKYPEPSNDIIYQLKKSSALSFWLHYADDIVIKTLNWCEFK